MPASDYIVYVDESGDHSLTSINPQYPVFVLAFCIFERTQYTADVVPAFQNFKFDYFGHDMVVLHSRDIRKQRGDFNILRDAATRANFVADLTAAIDGAPFTLIASVIDKHQLNARYVYPANPYDMAMAFCLERTYAFLRDANQLGGTTTFCFESRGAKEDADLELAFLRIISGANWYNAQMPFQIRFAGKQAHSTGMQLADLVAYPIGRHTINPAQNNAAYNVVKGKFRKSPTNQVSGWGLKTFP